MFYVTKILPQVADTNLQHHIDFLAFSRWCERARTAFYEELFPGLDFAPHGLVIVNSKIDYLKEIVLDDRIEIRSWVSRIGTKSFELTQEIWRTRDDDPTPVRCGLSLSVFCAIDFTVHKSEPLSDRLIKVLQKYEWSPDEQER
ncbi:MAG: acyl-CoA thioesterase [Thermoguttaceae bacterium]|jgi:acyl-CoA thioester hydrolase